jgi:hypothetical protein
MSSLVFPTLPGLDIATKRSEIYSTGVQAAVSGKDLRAAWWSTPKYQYTLTINFLRQANFSLQTVGDELVTLTNFYETHKGQWDSFLFNDPVDGVQRRVRFMQDSLDLEQIVRLAWKGGSIKLLSVK